MKLTMYYRCFAGELSLIFLLLEVSLKEHENLVIWCAYLCLGLGVVGASFWWYGT